MPLENWLGAGLRGSLEHRDFLCFLTMSGFPFLTCLSLCPRNGEFLRGCQIHLTLRPATNTCHCDRILLAKASHGA